MPLAKDCHALTSYYILGYRTKYGRAPVVNRNKARWGFDAILYDLNVVEVKSLLDYYFDAVSTHGHSIDWFFNNYDKLIETREIAEKDEADRARLREESKKRVEEWKKTHGNS